MVDVTGFEMTSEKYDWGIEFMDAFRISLCTRYVYRRMEINSAKFIEKVSLFDERYTTVEMPCRAFRFRVNRGGEKSFTTRVICERREWKGRE